MIIVACNTATVYTLEYLRSEFDLPIIGTVPVVKTLASRTKSGKVAIFSTPGTARSQYLKDLVKKFARGKKVYIVGGTRLEGIVERGAIDDPQVTKTINKFLVPLVAAGVDVIALSCTHYPFLKSRIQGILGSKVKIYDSGAAVARQTLRILSNNNLLSSSARPKHSFFTTGNPKKFKKVAKLLLNRPLAHVSRAEI